MIYQGQHVKSRNPVHTGGTEKYGNISGKTPKFLQHARYIRTVTCVFSWLRIYVVYTWTSTIGNLRNFLGLAVEN